MNKMKVKVVKSLDPTKILKEYFPEAYTLMVKHRVLTRWKKAFMSENNEVRHTNKYAYTKKEVLSMSFKTWRDGKRIDILIGGYFAWDQAKPLLEGTKFKTWGEVQRLLMKELTGNEFHKE